MYRLTKIGSIQCVADGEFVPPDNRDYLCWLGKGNRPEPYVPTPEEVMSEVTTRVQARLDTFFATRGYDSADSAAKYVTSKNRKYAVEGQYAVDACTDHWDACFVILADVQQGLRPLPTVEEVLAEMPVLAWPE